MTYFVRTPGKKSAAHGGRSNAQKARVSRSVLGRLGFWSFVRGQLYTARFECQAVNKNNKKTALRWPIKERHRFYRPALGGHEVGSGAAGGAT